jgi:uncharacterized protein
MVLHGQYLERATVIEAGGLALEGLYHRGHLGPPVLLVAPASGVALGGSPMELPLVAELAWALHRAGHPTLRYNPRGLGASQGESGDAATHLEDARAGLTHLLETVGAPRAAVVAVGEGAVTGFELSRGESCVGLVVVAPPESLAEALRAAGGAVHVLLAETAPWPEAGPPVERIAHADAAFLRGLPALGKAVAAYVAKLGPNPQP